MRHILKVEAKRRSRVLLLILEKSSENFLVENNGKNVAEHLLRALFWHTLSLKAIFGKLLIPTVCVHLPPDRRLTVRRCSRM